MTGAEREHRQIDLIAAQRDVARLCATLGECSDLFGPTRTEEFTWSEVGVPQGSVWWRKFDERRR
jgi:hypothetical protein